ncbi:MAG: hypothetical protein KKA05_01200 [Alphaproteobacteria bacterium]|nr:hypothetical protein [Alphaproteobacteria bacterium]
MKNINKAAAVLALTSVFAGPALANDTAPPAAPQVGYPQINQACAVIKTKSDFYDCFMTVNHASETINLQGKQAAIGLDFNTMMSLSTQILSEDVCMAAAAYALPFSIDLIGFVVGTPADTQAALSAPLTAEEQADAAHMFGYAAACNNRMGAIFATEPQLQVLANSHALMAHSLQKISQQLTPPQP